MLCMMAIVVRQEFTEMGERIMNLSVTGKSGLLVICLSTLGAFLSTSLVRAADITWTNGAGIWDATANWNPSTVPGSTDRAIFSDAPPTNAYAVSLSVSNDAVSDVLFNAGTASMNLFLSGGTSAYALTVTNTFLMDQTPAATAVWLLKSGVLAATNSIGTAIFQIGNYATGGKGVGSISAVAT